jgi:hypothetical protein
MGSAKHGGRILGLSVLAVWGAMALFAPGAQAQLPGESKAGSFSVNGGVPTGQALVGEQLGSGYLLVAARDLKIECTGGTLNSGVANNSTDAKIMVTFEGCVAQNHAGTPLKGCQYKELETIRASALALPIVHGGERFVLFEPLEGTHFTNISYKAETVCTLPLNNPLAGALTAKVGPEVEGKQILEGSALSLQFSQAAQLLTGDVQKYGGLANTGYLNATIDVELAGGGKLGVH